MSNTRKATGTRARKTATATEPPVVDLDALLDEEPKLPEDVVSVCLRGDLLAEWNRLKALFDAGPGEDDRAMLSERAAKRRIADQMADVEQQMRAGTVAFRLRALPRVRRPGMPAEQLVWNELLEAHPPRKDDKGKVHQHDAALGVNRATFFDALVRASIVEPEMTDERWDKLVIRLNDGQFDRLFAAAWRLNRDEVDVPFSRAVSMTRRLDDESRRHDSSGSPSNGSTGGSRGRSRSTSTTNTAG